MDEQAQPTALLLALTTEHFVVPMRGQLTSITVPVGGNNKELPKGSS